jgi:hypothetical protein
MFGNSQVRSLDVHWKMMLKWVVGKQVSKVINWFDFARNRIVITLVHNNSQFLNDLNRLSFAFPYLHLNIIFTNFLFPPCFLHISPIRALGVLEEKCLATRRGLSLAAGSSCAVEAGLLSADLACIGASFPLIKRAPCL